MRNDGGETARKPSSDLCASDAHRSEAGFPSKNGAVLRNGAQPGNGLRNELSSQNLPQLCAQRNISSLRGVGDASSQTCVRENEEIAALDLDGFLKNSARLRENAEKFEENEPALSPRPSKDSKIAHQYYTTPPSTCQIHIPTIPLHNTNKSHKIGFDYLNPIYYLYTRYTWQKKAPQPTKMTV